MVMSIKQAVIQMPFITFCVFRWTSQKSPVSPILKRKFSSASPSPPRDSVTLNKFDKDYRISRSPSNKRMSTSTDKHEKEHLDRKQLAKIKIIVPNVPNIRDQSGSNRRRRIEKGICTLEQVLQLAEDGRDL